MAEEVISRKKAQKAQNTMKTEPEIFQRCDQVREAAWADAPVAERLGDLPALSPSPQPSPQGEGEPYPARRAFRRARFADALPTWPPLPAGEGRGEGEAVAETLAATLFEIGVSAARASDTSLTKLTAHQFILVTAN